MLALAQVSEPTGWVRGHEGDKLCKRETEKAGSGKKAMLLVVRLGA